MKFRKGDVVSEVICEECVLLMLDEERAVAINTCGTKKSYNLGDMFIVGRTATLLYRRPSRKRKAGR